MKGYNEFAAMKVYIAGPITNNPDFRANFARAESFLQGRGYLVMNPSILPFGFEHAEYMKICLPMIDVCDAVYLLAGWEASKGAKMEYDYAMKQGKFIAFAKGGAA